MWFSSQKASLKVFHISFLVLAVIIIIIIITIILPTRVYYKSMQSITFIACAGDGTNINAKSL